MQTRARRTRRTAILGVLITALALGVAACGGDDESEGTPATTASPATTVPATVASGAGGLPCDSQVFLEIVRRQGEAFGLAPATVAALTPSGTPRCDKRFSTQVFAGPPGDPGPFPALFGPTPDQSAWDLVGINCKASLANQQREIC